MQEGKRLEALCHIRTIPELGRAIGFAADFPAAAQLQRRLATDLVHELSGFVKHLDEAGSELFSWTLLRFQIENVKVLVRGFINKVPQDILESHLVPLPENMALDVPRLMSSNSLDDFAARLPREKPYEHLRATALSQHDCPVPFFLEMALDNGYFSGLLSKVRRLSQDDLGDVRPLLLQEANHFQFMLVVRGKFLYRLPPESLRPLRLAEISDEWFSDLLAASDMPGVTKSGIGIVLDEIPVGPGSKGNTFDPAILEALAWKRYARLANMAFRRGHLGLGAVIGYAGLRRIEVANLITLSEGIPMRLTDAELGERLIPRNNPEAIHV
jgi:vacuolar-type H+-ATPase subunit C/Vma6